MCKPVWLCPAPHLRVSSTGARRDSAFATIQQLPVTPGWNFWRLAGRSFPVSAKPCRAATLSDFAGSSSASDALHFHQHFHLLDRSEYRDFNARRSHVPAGLRALDCCHENLELAVQRHSGATDLGPPIIRMAKRTQTQAKSFRVVDGPLRWPPAHLVLADDHRPGANTGATPSVRSRNAAVFHIALCGHIHVRLVNEPGTGCSDISP